MADPNELRRLAAALHQLRPDWPYNSLLTTLTRTHATRAYQDLAVAAVAVAVDPTSKTPARLAEHGPWWTAAYTASGRATETAGPGREPCCPAHPHETARNCRSCRAETIGAPDVVERSISRAGVELLDRVKTKYPRRAGLIDGVEATTKEQP